MNLDSILTTLETSGHSGHVISTEEGLVLHNSLLLLQNENHFRKIYFWGRIYGTDKDYYIAFGFTSDALVDRVHYYSTNCTDWGLLPRPTKAALKLTPLCTTKFQGDPALVIDILVEKYETGFEESAEGPTIKKLKEEDRLSATVHLVNEEAAVIPRGALFKRPDGVVVENIAFEGLNQLEARELKSFLHYRQPTQKWNTNLLTRDDYNYAMDFLDPIDMDIPEGCWSLKLVAGDTMVTLKSLYWPGFFAFHYIKSGKYGFVYFGHGKKVLDVPFLLHPNLQCPV